MMKTIGMSTMLLLSTLFVVGCVTGPEWEPPQEILNPQASAEQHPPISVRQAEGLEPAALP